MAYLVYASCVAAPAMSSSAIAPGVWGGDHIMLTVEAVGAHVELDCAHGEIDMPIEPDERKGFTVSGTFVREHTGPIRPGETSDVHPATYDGVITARRMTLTIRLTDLDETVGSFELTFGSRGRVVKCV